MKEEMKKIVNDIKKEAKDNNVPIMLEEGLNYLLQYIKKNRIKNILEIGTAVGYSAIRMALVASDIYVRTIEKDENRYQEALYNIEKAKLKRRIKVVLGDALEVSEEGKYDLIFIDAAKTKNIAYFEKYKDCLSPRGTIITDNISFHGLVENSDLIKTKNQQVIVRKIQEYIDFLNNNPDFKTVFVAVGDKIAVSKRNNNE